jgi:hypothetical protein
MKRSFLSIISFSMLCSSAQTGSEIYLFDLKQKDGLYIISNGTNITSHKGYDNQPFFHPTLPLIYYSSANDSGRTDIKYYDYKKKETANLTLTNEREYSPTVTPDGRFISCIIQRDNGAQDLGKYPIGGGAPVVLINNLKVGYHAWIDKQSVLLFVLMDSSNAMGVYTFHDEDPTYIVLANNIGRSLHKIPGQNAMSFVQQKTAEKEAMIKRLDLVTGEISPIIIAFEGHDFLTWLQNNTLLTSNGSRLISFHADFIKRVKPLPVTVEGDGSMLKGITRLATNADNTKLAVVVSE